MASAAAASPAQEIFTPSRRLMAGLVLALGNFMVVLDLTIANVSVPHIAGNLGISPDQGTWVITSYAVAEAICVPLTGWLSQRFGTVRLLTFSFAGFGLFSMLCGLSPTLGMLVAARIGQGLCGGPIMPMSQTLLMRIFPPEQRGAAMGVWALTTLMGPAVGPIIGGWISDNYSWHWIFFINLPVCVFCTLAAIRLLAPAETVRVKVPIDGVGLGLLVFWIGCLQIMLDIGRDHDWFADPLIVALAILAVIGFAVFIIWELTEKHPIVDLRVFRHRGFSFGVATLALAFGAYFASIVIIPQWLQTTMGYTATDAGLITALTAAAAMPVSMFVARRIGKMDPRLLISVGVGWLGIMALWRTGWTSEIDFFHLALPQFLQGLGIPLFMMPLTLVTLSSVDPEETASAAGLQNFLRTMAVAVSTSLVLTVWSDGQRTARSDIVSALQPDETQRTLQNAGMGMEQARQTISNLVEGQATMMAVNHVFAVSAVVLFCGALLVWLTPRPKRVADTSAAH